VDEVVAERQGQQAAVSECEAQQQIERDRREPPPIGQPCEERESDDRDPELDEDPCHVGRVTGSWSHGQHLLSIELVHSHSVG